MTLNTATPTRLAQQGYLGGVCAGVAAQLGLNRNGVRLAVLISACAFTAVTVTSYVIAWALMPAD